MLTNDDGGIKPWITYSTIAIVVAVGAYFVRAAWVKTDQPLNVNMLCITPGCGYTTADSPEIGSIPPYKCPKCNNESVLPGIKCTQCGMANVWNEARGLKGPTKCTKCGTEIRRGS